MAGFAVAHLAHDGFDGIFASCYANPNGDRTTAETSTEFYARLLFQAAGQDPARMRDLINRASRFGHQGLHANRLPVPGDPRKRSRTAPAGARYCQGVSRHPGLLPFDGRLLVQGMGRLSRQEQAVCAGLCTELGSGRGNRGRRMPSSESRHRSPAWEYNIDFRPQNFELKRYFIRQLPADTIAMLTWENGKSFDLDGMHGYLRDYSLNQIGPAEVTEVQIGEARRRGMKVYCKADTFAAWQFGTIPYLPFPYQWYDRYKALEKYGVNGTMESHSSGYTPKFHDRIAGVVLLERRSSARRTARRDRRPRFRKQREGDGAEGMGSLSRAIRLVPDTGPNIAPGVSKSDSTALDQRDAQGRDLSAPSWPP